MRVLTAILPLLILLASCSPEKHLARFLHRHPGLVKTDTVWVKDTVTVFGTRTDTIIKIWQKDTVIIKKDQLTIKYFMRNDSTVYLEGKCDTVTIIREVPVTVSSVSVQEVPSFRERAVNFLLDNIIVILLAMLIFLFLLRKNKS